ncbi:response regulator [Geobacter sulfurreducens]|uniref:response regulator n=1 Tax=Geobacter sulfurreducens TaxID=35554 RepID=UPI002BE84440|nr:response regulator [Geobacter sulfurreducens]HML79558.1 response regulator [Geobacter sulfurreducens]
MGHATEIRVLVVDESAPSRAFIASTLEKGGYIVTSVASGEEAVHEVNAAPFDILVTDINLPGMSGLNLLKLLKDSFPDLEVVIVTSNASSFTAIKALRLGAYDFIIKPVDDPAILTNIVGRAVEKQALTRENRRLMDDMKLKNRELHDALHLMKSANRLCTAISASLDAGEILKRLVEGAVEEVAAKKGYLLLLDRDGSYFSMKVSVGVSRTLAKGFRLRHDQGIAGLVVANNKPLRIDEEVPPPLTHRMLEEDPNGELFTTPGIITVPLQFKGRVAGVVTLSGRADGRSFTAAEIEFLTTLANHSAIALDTAGAFYKLKKGTS